MSTASGLCPIHDAACLASAWDHCPAVSALVSAVVLLIAGSTLFPLTPHDAPDTGFQCPSLEHASYE